jgi:hypothetical protein
MGSSPKFVPKAVSWTLVLLMLLLLGWYQLIFDEKPRAPVGFHLEPVTEPLESEGDGLAWFRSGEYTEDWDGKLWIRPDDRGILTGTAPWNELPLEKLIQAAPEMERRLKEALAHSQWLSEIPKQDVDPYQPDIRVHFLWNPGCSLKAAAMKALLAGDIRRAEELALLRREVGIRLVQGAEGVGALQSTCITFIADSERMLEQILVMRKFEPGALAAFSKMLEKPPFSREDVRRAMTWNYLEERNALKRARQGGSFSEPFPLSELREPRWLLRSRFKPQSSINRLTLWHAGIMPISLQPGRGNREMAASYRATLQEEAKKPAIGLSPNSFGQRMVARHFTQEWSIVEPLLMAQHSLRLCRQVVLAAKQWSLAHQGTWPATLTELVPAYLPAIPLDPYDELPVKWDPGTATAFVTGEDGKPNLPVIETGKYSIMHLDGSGACLP